MKKLKEDMGYPGNYQVIWNSEDDNGKKVPSGVYLCQLKTAQKIYNSRMLLLK